MKSKWVVLLILVSFFLLLAPVAILSSAILTQVKEEEPQVPENVQTGPEPAEKDMRVVKDETKSLEMTIPTSWQYNTKGAFVGNKKIAHRIVTSNNLDKYEESLTLSERVVFLEGLNAVDLQVTFGEVTIFEPQNCNDRAIIENRELFGVPVQTTIHKQCGQNNNGYIMIDTGVIKTIANEQVIDLNFVMTSYFENQSADQLVRSVGDSAKLLF